MASIRTVLQSAVVATATLMTVQAHAISLDFPATDAEVSFDGSYTYDLGSSALSLTLTAAYDGQAELQAVDGSVPDPNNFVFDLTPGADNIGGWFDLTYDRSLIEGSAAPGSQTGEMRFTVIDIVSFALDDMATKVWFIELDASVEDISPTPVYDPGLTARLTIAGTPLNASPIIQMHISASGGVSSTAVPETGALVLIAGGLAGLLVARSRR